MTTNNVALLFHIQSNPRYFNDIVNLIRQSALDAVHMLTVHNTTSIQLAVKSLFQRESSLKSIQYLGLI